DGAAALPARLEDWEQGLPGRPDLRALELAEQASESDATLARHQAIPDPALSLGYTRDKLVISGDQPRTLLFGLTVPLPLFDHGQRQAARAELKAEELRRTRQASLLRAHSQVTSLLERRQSLDHTLQELRQEAVPRSKSVLDSTVAAVNEGELSTTD